MPYLRPSPLLLLILSVLLSVLIFSCDPDEPEKKKPTPPNTQDKDKDDNNDQTDKPPKSDKPVIPPEQPTSKLLAPIASLGTISDNAKKDASGTGWVFQGEKIIFTATAAKDTDNKEIANVQLRWAWRKRGKNWKELSSKTKTVTIPIEADERVGAYELRLSATSNGKTVDNSKKLYKFTVRKEDGCPPPDTLNAPANLAELKAMVTGSSPSVTGEDLKAIDTSLVTDMHTLFESDTSFNGKINCWDVSNVTNMYEMFFLATIFNQNIGDWDVSNVINMSLMFFRARAFNNDNSASIGNWDVSNVENVAFIFNGASVFNQDLSKWNVTNVVEKNNRALFDSSTPKWEEEHKFKFKS